MRRVMTLVRHEFRDDFAPDLLARPAVITRPDEAKKIRGLRGLALKALAWRHSVLRIGDFFRLRFAVRLLSGDDEDLVTPNDRRGAAFPDQVRAPADIFPARAIPHRRRVSQRRSAIRMRPAPMRPILGGREDRRHPPKRETQPCPSHHSSRRS